VFDNKIWVIGGFRSGKRKNDVWFSSDGVTWHLSVDNAQWTARSFHACVVSNTKFFVYADHGHLWLLGGSYEKRGLDREDRELNDIWHTTDGRNWFKVDASIAWPPRAGHTSLFFDDRLWVLGGGAARVGKNDVWFSNDGAGWKQLDVDTGWTRRFGHSSVIFHDRMWVIGGGTNDVWFLKPNE